MEERFSDFPLMGSLMRGLNVSGIYSRETVRAKIDGQPAIGPDQFDSPLRNPKQWFIGCPSRCVVEWQLMLLVDDLIDAGDRRRQSDPQIVRGHGPGLGLDGLLIVASSKWWKEELRLCKEPVEGPQGRRGERSFRMTPHFDRVAFSVGIHFLLLCAAVLLFCLFTAALILQQE